METPSPRLGSDLLELLCLQPAVAVSLLNPAMGGRQSLG